MTASLRYAARCLLVICCAYNFSAASAREPESDAPFRPYIPPGYRSPSASPAGALGEGMPAESYRAGIPQRAREIRGSVTDSAGAPLPGVSVTVKGLSNVGTTTDLNGKYILNVPDDKAVLLFSMVGYDIQEFSVRGKEVINVAMKRNANSLDDVVVVAFGKQKKREVVGSVTTITPGELKVPSSNLTTALAGRLAGVIAYQRSGEPGRDNAEFFIRGITTFGYRRNPLILIDNVEYTTTDLARLQPDDIATFSIMKDATATALYGARGANGVVLITTKEGRQGKPKIAVRLENSLSMPTQNVKLADPITYMKLENEANATRGNLIIPYHQSKIEATEAGKNPYVYPSVDWREMIMKDYTMNQRANFSVGGGGQISSYYLAGSFNKDNGILNVDRRNNFNSNISLKSYSIRSNVSFNITKSTVAWVRLYGQFDDYTGPIDGGKDMYEKVMRSNPVLFPAWFPVDDDHKGTQHIMFGNFENGDYLNPYADLVKGYREENNSLMSAQVELNQNFSFITQGLTFKAIVNTNRRAKYGVARAYRPFWYQVGSYDKLNNTYKIFNINPEGGTDFLDYGETGKTVNNNFSLQTILNYSRLFADKHQVSQALVFMAVNQLEGNATNLINSLPSRNLVYSGRTTYGYDNRYFAEFNFGYNGSERFYKTKRYGFFPSAGLAWYISNENWFDALKTPITKLKLRGTYGMVGNDDVGEKDDRFFYLSNVNMSNADNGAYFGTEGGYYRPGISVGRYDNQEITWENAAKANVALEIGLFNNLEIIAEYWWEKRTNILMNRTIPKTLGLQGATPKANVGEAKAKGIDISIEYAERFGKDWQVNARGNFTYSNGTFLKYEEVEYDEKYSSYVGKMIGQRKGFIAERLFVDDEEVRSSPEQRFGTATTMGGDIKFRDVNGDGKITNLDQVFIGFPQEPQINFGFGVSATYKGWDMNVFFQGSARTSFFIDVEKTSPFIDNDGVGAVKSKNQLLKAYAESHWSEEDRNIYALWPRLSPEVHANNLQTSTWFMRDGSFIRLKQVEFGYTLPLRLSKKMKMESFRVYANGTNLYNWAKFKLWDVEMAGNGLGYPIQRVVNVGLDIRF